VAVDPWPFPLRLYWWAATVVHGLGIIETGYSFPSFLPYAAGHSGPGTDPNGQSWRK